MIKTLRVGRFGTTIRTKSITTNAVGVTTSLVCVDHIFRQTSCGGTTGDFMLLLRHGSYGTMDAWLQQQPRRQKGLLVPSQLF